MEPSRTSRHKGAGVHTDGRTKVADFLGVFNAVRDGGYEGNLVAFNTSTPFSDHFEMKHPGGLSNYTGVSQALGGRSFVWRGYMSGVVCSFRDKPLGDKPLGRAFFVRS